MGRNSLHVSYRSSGLDIEQPYLPNPPEISEGSFKDHKYSGSLVKRLGSDPDESYGFFYKLITPVTSS